jgi:hypothetical protein
MTYFDCINRCFEWVRSTKIFVETIKQCSIRCVAPKYRSLMVTVLCTLMKLDIDHPTNIVVLRTFYVTSVINIQNHSQQSLNYSKKCLFKKWIPPNESKRIENHPFKHRFYSKTGLFDMSYIKKYSFRRRLHSEKVLLVLCLSKSILLDSFSIL